MNDLMTKSFLSFVELKKQAMKDEESMSADVEMGTRDDAVDEQNLSNFFEEVAAIKIHMDEITNLLVDIRGLNQDMKSTEVSKALTEIRDKIKSDMINILRQAKTIKARLASLDRSNIENRNVLMVYKEGSPIDRTRVSVTHGLRVKLRGMIHDFQSLREQIVKDHMEGLKIKYYKVTGEEPNEEVIEKMILGRGQVKSFEGKEDLVVETRKGQEALMEIRRSLIELHYVFLDMAVLVETQEEKLNDIGENVAKADAYVNGGTNGLFYAEGMKKKRWKCACWTVALMLVLLFFCLIPIVVS